MPHAINSSGDKGLPKVYFEKKRVLITLDTEMESGFLIGKDCIFIGITSYKKLKKIEYIKLIGVSIMGGVEVMLFLVKSLICGGKKDGKNSLD